MSSLSELDERASEVIRNVKIARHAAREVCASLTLATHNFTTEDQQQRSMIVEARDEARKMGSSLRDCVELLEGHNYKASELFTILTADTIRNVEKRFEAESRRAAGRKRVNNA